jgi:hypothetical protein
VISDLMKLGEKQRPPRKKLEDFVFLNSYEKRLVV